MSASTGIVVIGRNEGPRLASCLDSVRLLDRPVVYVDSGSVDGSVALARQLGVSVVELDSETVSLAELTTRLDRAHSQYAGLRVIVRGDGAGRFQRVAEVLNACKAAGIGQLAISVKLADEQGAE